MNRRDFVASTAALGAIAIPESVAEAVISGQVVKNELYELRSYELAFGGNRNSLFTYLNDVLHPSLLKSGANHSYIFKELGDAEPSRVWTLVSFPSIEAYSKCLTLQSDTSFISKAATYADSGKSFNRYTSSLLYAFNGLPQMIKPGPDKNLFELRIYEGVNEDAVRRKISMFDNEEIDLFYKVGLNPVFFGDMKIGPFMPCLVYMLAFRDMDNRSKAWGDFSAHPDWNRMKVLPQYANTVSNIRKIFLEPI